MQRIEETDEQVRTNAHEFPEHIHLENIRCKYQSKHRHAEEREECVVTLESFFSVHIAERVDVYHKRHGRDDDKHHHADRVEQDTKVEMQVA